MTKVKGYGIFAYLSHIWLRELYQIIVTSSLLQLHGYLPTNHNSQPHALINLLTGIIIFLIISRTTFSLN